MDKPKKDRDGRFFEVGMLVEVLYPNHIHNSDIEMNEYPVRKVIDMPKMSNASGFVCKIESSVAHSTTFDPGYLIPIKYVTESLNLLYGKK